MVASYSIRAIARAKEMEDRRGRGKEESFLLSPPLRGGSKGGVLVRALASHQCGPGSTPGVDAICGLSLLWVLSLAPRGFSPGTPVFLSPQKQHFQIPIRSGTHGHV